MAMNKTVKGIVIEIGGDTTKLGKAINEADEESKKLSTELKDINRLLKLDPSSVELLKVKQDNLSDSIEATQKKLTALKNAQDKVQQMYANGQIDKGQYRQFQEEIKRTELELDKLKDEQRETSTAIVNGFGPAGEAVEKLKNKLSPVGDALKTVGSAVGAVKSGFNDLKNDAEKVAGALDKVTTAAVKVNEATAKTMKAGFDTVAGSVEVAAKGLTAYTATLTAATTAIASWAVGLGMDFDSTMSQVEALMTDEDKEAGMLQKLTDEAERLGKTTQFSASEAAQALTYTGMAGWSAQESIDGLAGILNLAAASGEDLAATSDIVTDAITAFGMSANESDRFADVLAMTASSANTDVGKMGETFKEVAPLAGAMRYSIEDMSLAIGLMANSSIKGSKSGTALKNIIANLAAPTDDAITAMQELGVSLTDSEGNTKDFNEVISELKKGFSGLTESQKVAYASTIAGKQGMAGLLAIVNSTDEDISKLREQINNCGGAAEEMAQIVNDNLAGDIKYLQANVESVGLSLSKQLEPALRSIVQGADDVVSAFSEGGVAGALDQISTILPEWISTVSEAIPEVLPGILEGFNQIVLGITDAAITALPVICDTVLPELITGFFGLVDGLIEQIPTALPIIAQGGITLLTGLMDGINQELPVLMDMVPEMISEMTALLEDNLPYIITSGMQMLGGLATGLADATPELITAVVELIPVIVDSIIDNIPALVGAGMELVIALAEGFPEAIPVLIGAIPQITAAIISAFIGTDWGDVGVNIIGGIGEGLIAGVGAIGSTLASVAEGVVGGLKNLLGIHSPSKVMEDQVGKYMALGIGEGFEETMKDVTNSMEDIIPTDFGAVPVNVSRDYNISTNTSMGELLQVLTDIRDKSGDVMIDGRTAGRVLAPVMSKQLAWS